MSSDFPYTAPAPPTFLAPHNSRSTTPVAGEKHSYLHCQTAVRIDWHKMKWYIESFLQSAWLLMGEHTFVVVTALLSVYLQPSLNPSLASLTRCCGNQIPNGHVSCWPSFWGVTLRAWGPRLTMKGALVVSIIPLDSQIHSLCFLTLLCRQWVVHSAFPRIPCQLASC